MIRIRREVLLAAVCAVLMFLVATAHARAERVVVLDFLSIDEQGDYIDVLGLELSDLVNLSRVMSQGISSRLVQYGEFSVEDSVSLREEIEALNFSRQNSAWERAAVLLVRDLADQVITGSITLLQNTVVLGAQRFQLVDGEPALVGSALATAPKIADATTVIDTLVADLFPSDVQVIERAIEQIFVVPAQLHLNLGQSKQITVYALDALGRPVANPQFLYFSGDEAKVNVDENGVVTGLQPGSSTITVRAISRTSRSGSPATTNVTVVPPTFGIRVGTPLTQRSDLTRFPIRLGLRITPMLDQGKSKTAAPTPSTIPAAPESSNPLSLIASYFGSMLTNGLVTIDFDFDPTRELLVAFSGVQRSSSGYISTGVGYVSPMDNIEAEKGFVLRFTMGTQFRTGSRLALPAEAVIDAIFPTSTVFSPSFRIGINVGFDLFP